MRQQLDETAPVVDRAAVPNTLTSTNPATGEKVWSGTIGDAAAEVAAARAAWPAWAAHSHAYRIEAVRRFANVVRKREEEFADLIARETGKPFWEARTEVAAVVNKVEISVDAYAERTPQRKMEAALGNRIALRHKPHGVLAVLGPYNFPAHLPNGHIVPALIAGNAVVFKPSEKTPATGAMLVECFHEAGIPEGVVRLLIGGPDQGRALAGQPGIDGLLFTGSARAGMALHKQFAETPQKMLALELGGNNPLVVWSAKDIEAAATIAVQSAFLTAGQRCTAARRLIVEDGKHGPLLETIGAMADRIIVDHPFADPQPFMGPVIDNAAADRDLGASPVEVELHRTGAVRQVPHHERVRGTRGVIDRAHVVKCGASVIDMREGDDGGVFIDRADDLIRIDRFHAEPKHVGETLSNIEVGREIGFLGEDGLAAGTRASGRGQQLEQADAGRIRDQQLARLRADDRREPGRDARRPVDPAVLVPAGDEVVAPLPLRGVS
jgi:succinylglutamic semialdehyde dehydrogenase